MDEAVLITGGNGFIGHYIAEECIKAGFRAYCIGRNKFPGTVSWEGFVPSSLEHAYLTEFFRGIKFKYCFHLAGSSHVPFSIANPYQDFLSLLPGTANLLNFLVREHPDCHLILASSAAVYGNPEELPVKESAQCAPLSPYGIHKLLSENLSCYYSNLYGLRVSAMRIFSAYGNGLKKQLLWDLAKKMFSTEDGIIELFGDGNETRDYIHAKDIGRAAMLIAKNAHNVGFEVFNLANSEEISVKQVADTLVKKSGTKIEVVFNGSRRPGDPIRWKSDSTKLKKLGYSQSIDFNTGAGEYFSWAKKVLSLNSG